MKSMSTERKLGETLMSDQYSCGTREQKRAIQKWEGNGWTLLYWTQVPRLVAVIENCAGDVAFIDHRGRTWTGPGFSKTEPVRQERPPLAVDNE